MGSDLLNYSRQSALYLALQYMFTLFWHLRAYLAGFKYAAECLNWATRSFNEPVIDNYGLKFRGLIITLTRIEIHLLPKIHGQNSWCTTFLFSIYENHSWSEVFLTLFINDGQASDKPQISISVHLIDT